MFDKTLIEFILDRSGSMNGRQADVVGGANRFLQEQRLLPHPALVGFTRFDDQAIERFRTPTPLKETLDLRLEEFVPRGMTPLLDAIGQTLIRIDSDWREIQPSRAIVIIITDGLENHSREYTRQKIQSMIRAREQSGRWTFIYLGANIDSFAEAGSIGISMANTANYKQTREGVYAMYAAASAGVSNMRASGAMTANLGGDIAEDGSITPPTPVLPSDVEDPVGIEETWQPPTVISDPVTTEETWQPPQ